MAEALGHPQFGYYRTRDPLGVAGDFTTAPEISQVFGELIGLWMAEMWRLHGAGLANVMFAREGAVVVEFKGSYGMTDFVYRKYAQAARLVGEDPARPLPRRRPTRLDGGATRGSGCSHHTQSTAPAAWKRAAASGACLGPGRRRRG